MAKPLTSAELQAVAAALQAVLPARVGFALFTFPFRGAGDNTAQYVSNCDREAVQGAMREMLAAGQPDLPSRRPNN